MQADQGTKSAQEPQELHKTSTSIQKEMQSFLCRVNTKASRVWHLDIGGTLIRLWCMNLQVFKVVLHSDNPTSSMSLPM